MWFKPYEYAFRIICCTKFKNPFEFYVTFSLRAGKFIGYSFKQNFIYKPKPTC